MGWWSGEDNAVAAGVIWGAAGSGGGGGGNGGVVMSPTARARCLNTLAMVAKVGRCRLTLSNPW